MLVLHDRPHNRKRPSEEPYPAEEVAALRQRLADSEYPSDEDRRLLSRMDLACQVTWCNLYPPEAVVPITKPTQTQAWDLLSGLWKCGSHREQFIFGGQDEETGEKWCFTAGGKIIYDWNILNHKKGSQYLGIKRGGNEPESLTSTSTGTVPRCRQGTTCGW